jgi:hypothetical protein
MSATFRGIEPLQHSGSEIRAFAEDSAGQRQKSVGCEARALLSFVRCYLFAT